ncbi:MAG: KH domain-containing protein [Firmicutes bacterium]|nr:KH domain-containing protein [Bacillota bacterium]
MSKVLEITAKTIDEAIADGLEQLGASYDEVEVEVLSNGGMFKKAKVKLTLTKEPAKVEEKKPETKIEPVIEKPKETKKEEKTQVPAKEKIDKPKIERAPTPKGDGKKLDECVYFVTEFLRLLGNDATVSNEETEKSYMIHINGEDVGRLIGKGGEALNALQTLVSSVAISHANGDNKRVFVNIENYKEKRTETLQSLAKKKAEYVKESGRYVKLEPMIARDRAIIHTVIQSIEGVRSYSTGEGVNRRLVIAPANKEQKQENPSSED